MNKDDIINYIKTIKDKSILDEINQSIVEQKRIINPTTEKKFITGLKNQLLEKINNKYEFLKYYHSFEHLFNDSLNKIALDVANQIDLSKITLNNLDISINVSNDILINSKKELEKTFTSYGHLESTMYGIFYKIMIDKKNNNINKLLDNIVVTAFFDKEIVNNIKDLLRSKFNDSVVLINTLAKVPKNDDLYETNRSILKRALGEATYKDTGRTYKTYSDLLYLDLICKLNEVKDFLEKLPTSDEYLSNSNINFNIKIKDKELSFILDLKGNIIEKDIEEIQLGDI